MMKKYIIALVLIVFCITSFTACTNKKINDSEIVIIDQADREVKLSKPAEKIVSSYYISSALLIALEKEDNVVGIEMKADTRNLYKMAAPHFLDLPAVGSGKGINVEETIALKPDLVILPKKLLSSSELFEAVNIPVIVVDPESMDDFTECVKIIAKATGTNERAEKLLTYYEDTNKYIENALKDVQDEDKPTVYLSSSSSIFSTTTAKMYQNDLINMAGGKNVSGELEDSYWVEISPEQLVSWNPEYMFNVVDADYTKDDILSNEGIKVVQAIENNNIYTIPSKIEAWDYPTPSSVLGLLWMTHTLHPNVISKEEYINKTKEFYKDFFDIEVSETDI